MLLHRAIPRFSLAAKISVLAITLIVVTAVGVCVFVVRSEMATYYQDLLNHGMTIADTASQNCELGIYTEDTAHLNGVLQGLSTDAAIVYVAVLDRNGAVLASSVFRAALTIPSAPAEAEAQPRQVRYRDLGSRDDRERYLDIVYPVAASETGISDPLFAPARQDTAAVIGYLRLGLSQEGLKSKIRQLVASTVGFTSVLVVLGSVLSVYLARRITKPLEQLQNAAHDISEGKFDTPLAIRTRDEIADLAQAFDFMSGSLRRYRDQLLHDALHDSLTGLPNRMLLTDRLRHAIDIAKRRKGYDFGVLFLDLDSFKVVNDSLGHTIGDRLLVEFGNLLAFCVRPGDTVARLGGDEFAVLLEDVSGEGNAVFICTRVLRELEKPFRIAGHDVFATCSIGIALGSAGYEEPEDLLRDADTAMYKAKSLGRSNYAVFEPRMHDIAVNRLQTEMNLRKAVDRREFEAFYQPIVSIAGREVAGFEALARWRHPERGLVMPGEFIQVAEETGLIVTIDRLVLRQACEYLKHLQDRGGHHVFVSVNLSNRQIGMIDLVEHVALVIRETGVDPAGLKLEITENVAFASPESAIALLQRLRALGVQLYIDDFGTGYSSLSYVHRLPINGLKIDRSFVKGIGEAGENGAIVRTIMSMAREMNIEAIAEGIETEGQRQHIESLQCRYWQGYLFSRPVSGDDARRLMTRP